MITQKAQATPSRSHSWYSKTLDPNSGTKDSRAVLSTAVTPATVSAEHLECSLSRLTCAIHVRHSVRTQCEKEGKTSHS